MRGWAWLGCVLWMAACTRDNGAFEGGVADASSSASKGTSGDSLDGPATSVATGAADGTSTTATTNPMTGAMESTSEGTGETGASSSGSETGGPLPKSCCNPELPCDNAEVSVCACNLDPGCCGADWGLYCVSRAVAEGCGMLMCETTPNSCCMVSPLPGCNDFETMACVCAEHPGCCNEAWGPACTEAAMKCPENACAGGQ